MTAETGRENSKTVKITAKNSQNNSKNGQITAQTPTHSARKVNRVRIRWKRSNTAKSGKTGRILSRLTFRAQYSTILTRLTRFDQFCPLLPVFDRFSWLFDTFQTCLAHGKSRFDPGRIVKNPGQTQRWTGAISSKGAESIDAEYSKVSHWPFLTSFSCFLVNY